MSNWNHGNNIGTLYEIREVDLGQVGDCWMRGRLLVEDLVLCIAHTGDCFNDYILVKKYMNGIRGIPQSRFGAYRIGEEVAKLSDSDFHLLCAGQFIKTREVGEIFKEYMSEIER